MQWLNEVQTFDRGNGYTNIRTKAKKNIDINAYSIAVTLHRDQEVVPNVNI